jgi:hypothetical protein
MLSGCADRSEPTSPRIASPPGTAPNRTMLADTNAWNAYGADVTTTVHNVRGDGKPAAFAELPMTRHIEHRLVGDRWHTTMVMGLPAGTMPPDMAAKAARSHLTRVEDDGDGSPPRMYTADGRLIQRRSLRDFTHGQLPPSKAPVLPPRSTSKGRPPASRSTVQSIILSLDGVAARQAALRKAFGSPTPIADNPGFDRYVIVHEGSVVTTITVDTRLAATTEMVQRKGADTTLHVMLTYEAGADGVATLTRERIERPAKRAGDWTIVETTYRNVYLAKRN